jgi:hypothetical protein
LINGADGLVLLITSSEHGGPVCKGASGLVVTVMAPKPTSTFKGSPVAIVHDGALTRIA